MCQACSVYVRRLTLGRRAKSTSSEECGTLRVLTMTTSVGVLMNEFFVCSCLSAVHVTTWSPCTGRVVLLKELFVLVFWRNRVSDCVSDKLNGILTRWLSVSLLSPPPALTHPLLLLEPRNLLCVPTYGKIHSFICITFILKICWKKIRCDGSYLPPRLSGKLDVMVHIYL